MFRIVDTFGRERQRICMLQAQAGNVTLFHAIHKYLSLLVDQRPIGLEGKVG